MKKLSLSLLLLFISMIAISCSTMEKSAPKGVTAGLEELKKGNTDNAKEIFKANCDLNERSACAQLSAIYFQELKKESALAPLKKACTLGAVDRCYSAGYYYLREGNLKEAKEAFSKGAPYDGLSQIGLAILKYYEKKPREFYQITEDLCSRNFHDACYVRGNFAEYENDFKTAQKFFELPPVINQDEEYETNLAINAFMTGNRKKGEQLAKQSCLFEGRMACRISKLLQMENENSHLTKDLTVSCQKSNKDSCYFLGLQNYLNSKTRKKAAQIFKKSCQLGNGFGCLEAANALPPFSNEPVILTISKEACDKEAGSACHMLSEMTISDNSPMQLALLEKGCQLGEGSACLAHAYYLHNHNKNNEALIKYEMACKKQSIQGCFWANQLSNKTSAEKEKSLKDLCLQGYGRACERLAYSFKEKKEMATAKDFYKQACAKNNYNACTELAEKESLENKNFNKLEAYSKLCEQKFSNACYTAGVIQADANNFIKAKDLFSEGCYLRNGESCAYLGYLYQEEKNEKEKISYFHRACDLGSIYGCKYYEAEK